MLGMPEDAVLPEGDVFAADRGALHLAEKGIRMRFAAGDFDSVTKEELELIRAYADEIRILNPVKDDTDSEEVIRTAASRGYRRMIVYGGTGGRIDHTLINLKLAELYADRLWIVDGQNEICVHTPGVYEYHADEYSYFSLIVLEESVISLSGTKYCLDHRTVRTSDLYTTSNEITEEKGILTVHSGKVMVIRSHD